MVLLRFLRNLLVKRQLVSIVPSSIIYFSNCLKINKTITFAPQMVKALPKYLFLITLLLGGLCQASALPENTLFSTLTAVSSQECACPSDDLNPNFTIHTTTPGARKEKIKSEFSVIEIEEEQDERVSFKRNLNHTYNFTPLSHDHALGHFGYPSNTSGTLYSQPFGFSTMNRPHIFLQVFRI